MSPSDQLHVVIETLHTSTLEISCGGVRDTSTPNCNMEHQHRHRGLKLENTELEFDWLLCTQQTVDSTSLVKSFDTFKILIISVPSLPDIGFHAITTIAELTFNLSCM